MPWPATAPPPSHALVGFALVALSCGVPVTHQSRSWDPRWGDQSALELTFPQATGVARPGVLVVHGGGWNSGDTSNLATEAERLARAGFVVGNINYRLSPAWHFPVQLEDVWCALSAFRAHAEDYGLDPARVAVLGHSAGGNLVELMGLQATSPDASDCPSGSTFTPALVISGSGPSNLFTLPALGASIVQDYVGDTPDHGRERYQAASPLYQVHGGAPPYVLVHGTGDWVVPVEQSTSLREALVAQGNDVELLLVDGGGHLLSPGADPGAAEYITRVFELPEVWPTVLDALVRHLGSPP